MEFAIGQNVFFKTYDSDINLQKHSGKMAVIIRPLRENEVDIFEIENMYVIKFSDGFDCHAFEDELYNSEEEMNND